MKICLVAAAFATLTAHAMAGAATREVQELAVADRATTQMLADASHLGSASLTTLNGNRWGSTERRFENDAALDTAGADMDTGTLLIGATAIAFLLVRPLTRALRRQAHQRRAAALASTLPRR